MEQKTYTEIDFLKQELENELEKALILIEDAQSKMDLLLEDKEERTPTQIYNSNQLTTIILILHEILDK